jgi:hypothetical protein
MREIITFIFILLFMKTTATEQSCDKLIYKSDTICLNKYPLDSLMKIFPPFEKRILNYSYKTCVSSDCWRGYIGTWIIQNDSLYLAKLTNGCEDYTFKLNRLFRKRKTVNGKIFAYWYSSEIKAEYGLKKIRVAGVEKYAPTKLFIAKIREGKIIELITENIDYNK